MQLSICWLVLAVTYFMAAQLGLMLAFEQANTSPVWPPTGISIAALLYFGMRVWPGIFIGAFLINYYAGLPFLAATSIASGNTLEGVVAGYLILRFASHYPFSSVNQVFKFVLIVMFATTLSAFIGVSSLVIGGMADGGDFWLLGSTWWLGDLVGALVITPLLLTWVNPSQVVSQLIRVWEFLLLVAVTLLCSGVIFSGWYIASNQHYPLSFIYLPLAIWASYRFREAGASFFIMLLSVVAIIGTLKGYGPFVNPSENISLLLLQGFMGILVITTMVLAANTDEKLRADVLLKEAQVKLERRVQQRTFALSESNVALEAEMANGQRTVEALRSLLGATALSADKQFFRVLARDLAKIYNVQYVLIGTFDGDGSNTVSTLVVCADDSYLENFEYNFDKTARHDLAENNMVSAMNDAVNQLPGDDFINHNGIESHLSAPVVSPSNELIGLVAIMDTRPMVSRDWAKPMLGIMANRIALELERIESEEELKLAASVFNESVEAIMITDSNGTVLRVNPAFTRITGYQAINMIGNNPRVLSSGHHDKSFYDEFWRVLNEKGVWQGEMWDRRQNGEVFPVWQTISAVRNKEGKVIQYISIFSDITEKKLSEERIFHLAHYDVLTALPNRAAFTEQLERSMLHAKRNGTKLALLFLDVDHFKLINDASGHSAGDQLLKHIGQCLTSQVRAGDVVSRLGGDEFTLMLPEIQSNQDAVLVADKVLKAISKPFEYEQADVVVTASIGISIYPDDATDASVLLKHADVAMYRAKDQGRNNYQFFTEEMNTRALERLSLESALRKALENEEFLLHYQPQVSLETGEIVGLEALVRWQHPEQGLVSPAVFIPVAEESGLIVPLGEWVLRTACLQLKKWMETDIGPVRLAVNLSARQIMRQNLVQLVESIVAETGIDPQFLELELTESMIMEHLSETIETMHALRAMGVHLAIDDFGMGYSSMSYLKRFPINKLKIDQSFVRDIASDPDDAAIVTATIALGHSLNLVVIAEGVETEEQLNFLKDKDCEQMQGYFFSRPLTVEDATDLLLKDSKLEKEPICLD